MAAIDVDAVLEGGSSLSVEGTVRFAAGATLAGGSSVVAVPTVLVGPVVPVRYNVPSREVPSGRVSFDQVDLFLGDGMTRAQDVSVSDLLLRIFFNNTQLDWPLVSGVDVPDIRVAAGKVYWTEISAGFYSVRFVPNAVGPWRLLLSYEAEDQAVSLTYTAVPVACPPGAHGLQASFTRRLPEQHLLLSIISSTMVVRSSAGVFKWGQVFQREDLPIFITDAAGNPVSPYKVTYTLYYLPPGQPCPQQVGPCDRTPVMAAVGEYYVSSVAGECGQPGDWFVEWKYQEEGTPPSTLRMGFQVFNTGTYCPPGGSGGSGGCGCSTPCGCGGYPACNYGCRNPCRCPSTCPPNGW